MCAKEMPAPGAGTPMTATPSRLVATFGSEDGDDKPTICRADIAPGELGAGEPLGRQRRRDRWVEVERVLGPQEAEPAHLRLLDAGLLGGDGGDGDLCRDGVDTVGKAELLGDPGPCHVVQSDRRDPRLGGF